MNTSMDIIPCSFSFFSLSLSSCLPLSWHFPELVKIVSDNYQYVRVAKAIQDKSEITDDKIEKVKEILQDDEKV